LVARAAEPLQVGLDEHLTVWRQEIARATSSPRALVEELLGAVGVYPVWECIRNEGDGHDFSHGQGELLSLCGDKSGSFSSDP
jgi:hypothetical protein